MPAVIVAAPAPVILYDAAGTAMAVSDGVAIPAGTKGLLILGSDGTNAKFIRLATDGTVRIDPTGTTAQPITDNAGSLTIDTTQLPAALTGGGNFKVAIVEAIPAGNNNIGDVDVASLPSATVAGAVAKIVDYDTGAGTDSVPIFGIALPKAGGAVAGGTSTDPIRTDPTGTTAQPVTDNGGSLSVDDNGSSLTVDTPQLPSALSGSGNLNTAVVEALPAGTNNIGDVDLASAIPAGDNIIGRVKVTDGTNLLPTGDVAARSIFEQISDGTNGPVAVKPASTAPAATDKALVVVLSPNQQSIPVSSSPVNSVGGFTFGDVSSADVNEKAVRRTTYTEPAAGAQRSISSSSANDTSAGTGARTVRITYYTLNAGTVAGPFTEDKTLNGTTAVATTATDICYVEKMEVLTAGSGGTNAGVITLFVNNAGGGGTIGTIGTGDKRTFWAHHYVASSKTCYITSQWGGHNGTTVGSGGTFIIKAITVGASNQVEKQVSDSFRLYGQSSSVQRNYGTPIPIVGPARVVTYVTPESSTSLNYRASFDFYDQ